MRQTNAALTPAGSGPFVASATVGDMLHALLDQAEQVNRRRAPRVRLSASRYPAYFAQETVAPRKEANEAFGALEREDVLRLGWRRYEEGYWLEWVELAPQGAARLYGLLGRTPRHVHDATLDVLLAEQNPGTDWLADFLAWVRQQRHAGRALSPLTGDNPVWDGDLLQALDALSRLDTPTLERHFSIRTFGNSKRWEDLKSAALMVVRRHAPALALFGDDDTALLRALNLEKIPQHLAMAGPLQLRLRQTAGDDALVDLGPFVPSVALASATLREAQVVSCRARALVTIENLTSFSELAALGAGSVLIVYTGGFASPSLMTFLERVRQGCPRLPFFHWGDMDAGGLRILAHLRRRLGTVLPIAMDPVTFTEHRRLGGPLTAGDQTALALLRRDPSLSDCIDLIDVWLETGCKVEQEAVAADKVISLINQALA